MFTEFQIDTIPVQDPLAEDGYAASDGNIYRVNYMPRIKQYMLELLKSDETMAYWEPLDTIEIQDEWNLSETRMDVEIKIMEMWGV